EPVLGTLHAIEQTLAAVGERHDRTLDLCHDRGIRQGQIAVDRHGAGDSDIAREIAGKARAARLAGNADTAGTRKAGDGKPAGTNTPAAPRQPPSPEPCAPPPPPPPQQILPRRPRGPRSAPCRPGGPGLGLPSDRPRCRKTPNSPPPRRWTALLRRSRRRLG